MIPPFSTSIGGAKLMIFSNDGQFLLMTKEKRIFPDGSSSFMYNLPGGAQELMESHLTTAKREAQEEINYEVTDGAD